LSSSKETNDNCAIKLLIYYFCVFSPHDIGKNYPYGTDGQISTTDISVKFKVT